MKIFIILTGIFSDTRYPNGDVDHSRYYDGICVHKHYMFPIPEGVDLADACASKIKKLISLLHLTTSYTSPMLCSSLTLFSPLIRNGCRTTVKKVAIVGVGGL